MIAEREIAGFVLPFAAGIAASIFAEALFLPTLPHLVTASLLTASACIAFLCHHSHNHRSRHCIWALILTSAVSCGYLTGCTYNIISVASAPNSPAVPEWLERLGHMMRSSIHAIPFDNPNTNKIISALISGERHGIPHEISSAFQASGAAHILALSGLHLGIIYGFISRILAPIGNSLSGRMTKSVITIAICGIYTAVTGAGASITRAFLFILTGEVVRLTGRYRNITITLWATLFIQLLTAPSSITNVGFQLSYSAMAGIAFFFPWLKNLWPEGKRNGIMKRIWTYAAMSIACQITTGPLAYLYFETFPKYFLLTNILALPLTGMIIPAGITATVLQASGTCPAILIQITEFLVNCLTDILTVISTM